MQKIHLKLTSKYPRYHNWHQTKHHNKIHWGVFVVFTFFVFGMILRWTPITFAADTTAPTTPTNLTATAISSSQINLSWTASTDNVGVTGYKIYRCSGAGCAPATQIATAPTNSYSDTGLTASTAYTYAVSAYDAAGNESGKSTSVNATTQSISAYVPPSGTPLANKEHPRLFFTASDLPALRSKLKTQYKVEFQTFINAVDADFANDIAAKANGKIRNYDAMNYAFLYLVDPMQMSDVFTFAHNREEYGKRAIDHGLYIVQEILSGSIIYLDQPAQSYPVTISMAVVYDWVYPLFNLQNKQKFADAFIKSFAEIRPIHRIVGLPFSEHHVIPMYLGPTGALAFWGDDIDGGITGTYYFDWAQKLLDQLKSDWLDRVYPSLDYFHDKSGWRESWSYDEYYFSSTIFFTGMLSTALGKDYFYNTGYYRYHPLFFLYSIRPYSYNGRNFLTRYDTMSDTGITQGMLYYSKMLHQANGSLGNSDPNMAGLAKWIIDKGYASTIGSTDSDIRFYYLFYHFIWGNKNIISKSPNDLNLPVAQQFGNGQVIMRSEFDSPSATLIEFYAPKFFTFKHSSKDWAAFTIEKFGKLALNAGNGKSMSVEGKGVQTWLYGGGAEMLANRVGVYKPGEVNSDGYNFMNYRSYGLNADAPIPTDPAYQEGGANQVGKLKAWEPNTGDYNYLSYDYTKGWDSAKVSYANREFLYLNPTVKSSKEYIIVFDRVTSVDLTYKKRFLLWSAFEPQTNGTFTQDPDIAWKYDSTNSDTVKITNTYGTNHGRLFSKTILPNNFKIIKTGGPYHEYTDAAYKDVTLTGGSLPVSDAFASWIGAWRVEVESTTNQKDDLFLHVLEIGDSNTLTDMTPTSRIDAGNMVGTLIADPAAPRIVLFSKDPTGATVSSSAYTANYSSSLTGKHLLADMTPGTYDIYKNGAKILSGITASSQGTLHFESAGGSTFSIVKTGVAPPPADATSPTTPTNLTATAVSSSQINLSWIASTDNVGVTGYKIYRCSGSGCAPTTQIATSATNSYSNTGLIASTAYIYAVSAYDAAGNESGKSASINATTLSQFKPSDLNQDQKVDQQDFDILKQDFNRTDKPVSDLNQDGIVDSRDLGIMMSEWTR